MPDNIKCHELCQYGYQKSVMIRQNDLSDKESVKRNKIIKKSKKTKFPIFPLYFWANSIVK